MASRRQQILATAAELFAERGFHGVSVAELGAACGVSGPALYKHFAAKNAMLTEMLVASSQELLAGARNRLAAGGGLEGLVEQHIGFALAHRALIVVQERDWTALPPQARREVRRLQRGYVDVWAAELHARRPDLDPTEARARVHAVFGMLNSTPHSGLLPDGRMQVVLREMAVAALLGADAQA